MSFSLNNKLVVLIDSLKIHSRWFSQNKNLGENDLKHLSQDFDSKVLDLVKQKGFSPFEYTSDLGNFNKTLPSKNAFYSSSLSDKEISVCVAQHVHKVWNKFEMKMTEN